MMSAMKTNLISSLRRLTEYTYSTIHARADPSTTYSPVRLFRICQQLTAPALIPPPHPAASDMISTVRWVGKTATTAAIASPVLLLEDLL